MDRDTTRADEAATQRRADRDETDAVHPPTRRALLRGGGKLLIYAVPLIQVFRPTQAFAVSGLSPTS